MRYKNHYFSKVWGLISFFIESIRSKNIFFPFFVTLGILYLLFSAWENIRPVNQISIDLCFDSYVSNAFFSLNLFSSKQFCLRYSELNVVTSMKIKSWFITVQRTSFFCQAKIPLVQNICYSKIIFFFNLASKSSRFLNFGL